MLTLCSIIQAGTLHSIYVVYDAVVLGSCFYSPGTMELTCCGWICEAVVGPLLFYDNDSRPELFAILFGYVQHLWEDLQNAREGYTPEVIRYCK